MKLSDYDFELPERLIATRPMRPRSASRLLVAAQDSPLRDLHVTDLPDLLRPGDRLVLNDTRVLAARLSGLRHRDSAQGPVAAKIELTLLAPRPDGRWEALLKPLRKVREGEEIVFSPELSARLLGREGDSAIVEFNRSGDDFDAALARVGRMPLPPYIASRRPADARDNTDYQTVFARHPGAVAAPTASLHFDEALLAALAAREISFSHVTLHVGAGTFLPVKVDDISQHRMHAEWGEVSRRAAEEIRATHAAGGRVIAVGTTALRLIETAAQGGDIVAWRGATDIFIRPGYQFRVTDGLMTNFHLPRSTLMMLVSALMGRQRIRETYAHAIGSGYRFFSYGDASLLFPERQE